MFRAALRSLMKSKQLPHPQPHPHSHAGRTHGSKRDWTWSSDSIPPSPPVGVQLFSFVRSPDYCSEGVVELVRVDPDLTAQLLRISNSVVYRGKEPVASLHEAVLRLGAAVLAEKTMSLMVRKLTVPTLPPSGVMPSRAASPPLTSAGTVPASNPPRI